MFSCKNEMQLIESEFKNGSPKVVGLYTVDTDTIKSGELHDYPNEQLRMKASFDPDGLRSGSWEYYYEDGTPWSFCEYKSGVKHGGSSVFYKNGKLRYVGKYNSDQVVSGSFKYYNEAGELVKEE